MNNDNFSIFNFNSDWGSPLCNDKTYDNTNDNTNDNANTNDNDNTNNNTKISCVVEFKYFFQKI